MWTYVFFKPCCRAHVCLLPLCKRSLAGFQVILEPVKQIQNSSHVGDSHSTHLSSNYAMYTWGTAVNSHLVRVTPLCAGTCFNTHEALQGAPQDRETESVKCQPNLISLSYWQMRNWHHPVPPLTDGTISCTTACIQASSSVLCCGNICLSASCM